MKQESSSYDCVAVVAAMITDTSVELFKKVIRRVGRGYYDDELWRYLRDFLLVGGIPLKRTKYAKKISSLVALEDAGIMQFPATLTVASEKYQGALHILYWDGKKIHDPNPDVKDGRHPSEYDIYCWCPITKCV